MSRVTIIGAGIAGLVSAALAQARGWNVTVIEAGPAVGGLWKSTEVELDGWRLMLDAGLRLPVATGDKALDGLVFHRPDFTFDWMHIDGWPRESAITARRFNPENSCLDATVLAAGLDGAIEDMRSADGHADPLARASDYSLGHYGAILTHSLVRDAVLGLFGMELADLDARAVQWFVPRRVILGDPAATARLLQDRALSGRVAHARHADLPPGMNKSFLHPFRGGISIWVDALHASLEASGVRFILNDGVEALSFDASSKKIAKLVLKSGMKVELDAALCTVAPAMIARAAGWKAPPSPLFRHLRISHLLVDRAPDHQASYSLNFNADARFFRAVFHDNLGYVPVGPHVVTFEHLFADGDERDLTTDALAECIDAGAMPPGTRLIAGHWEDYRNNVPIPTVAHGRETMVLRHLLASIPNLYLAGRSAGGAPFLDQVIREIDETMDVMTGACRHD